MCDSVLKYDYLFIVVVLYARLVFACVCVLCVKDACLYVLSILFVVIVCVCALRVCVCAL